MRPDKDKLLNGQEPLAVRIANLLVLVRDDAVTVNEAALWLEELASSRVKPSTAADIADVHLRAEQHGYVLGVGTSLICIPRYDNQVDEIADSKCLTCGEKFKIVEVFATTVDVECGCGPSEFDLVPENELDEAEVQY
jgi:hypothetical protein